VTCSPPSSLYRSPTPGPFHFFRRWCRDERRYSRRGRAAAPPNGALRSVGGAIDGGGAWLLGA
jgi:hypothetical protein